MQISKIEVSDMPSAVIDRAALKAAFDAVDQTVEARNTIPILDHIRIQGDGDRMRLTGTDLDVEIIAEVPAAIDSRMDTTVEAKLLKKLLSNAPKCDHVAATQRDGNVLVEFEKAKYVLPSLAVADFARMVPATSAPFRIAGKNMRDYLARVNLAISTEETRYYLNGVFFHEFGGRLAMTATDGHRCHYQTFDKPEGMEELPSSGGYPGLIVPRKTCEILHTFLKGKQAPEWVEIRTGELKIQFRFAIGDMMVTINSKTVDGTFPDYQRIIPRHNFNIATATSADIMEGIKATKIILNKGKGGLKFTFGEKSYIAGKSADGAASSYQIKAEWSPEDADNLGFEIGLNSEYVAEICSILPGTIRMQLDDAGSPIIMVSDDAPDFLAVLMPMRV